MLGYTRHASAIPCRTEASSEKLRGQPVPGNPDHPFNIPAPADGTTSSHISHILLVILLASLVVGLMLHHRIAPARIAVSGLMPQSVAVPPPRCALS